MALEVQEVQRSSSNNNIVRLNFVGTSLPTDSNLQYNYRTLSIESVTYDIYSTDDIIANPSSTTSQVLPAGDSGNVATNPESDSMDDHLQPRPRFWCESPRLMRLPPFTHLSVQQAPVAH